jgi:hypothetical protein
VLSIELKAASSSSALSTPKLLTFLQAAPKDEVYRIKAIATLSLTPQHSDPDVPQLKDHPGRRYILNWAFGRWTFTPLREEQQEHESSTDVTLRMTVILARYESNRWKKKVEAGGYLELDGVNKGELSVSRIL